MIAHTFAATGSETKRVERVSLACMQCRGRHVKCDAVQPMCGRCKRDGTECNFQKSRRGGLDKAALERRRLRIQREEERARPSPSIGSSPSTNQSHFDNLSDRPNIDALHTARSPFADVDLTFQINADRLLEFFFENFWPAFPIALPYHHLQQRRLKENNGLEELLLVIKYIGSIYAPWTPSESFRIAAVNALNSPLLAHTPFTVQALMMLGLAQYYCNMRQEGQRQHDRAVSLALELRMNEKEFAQAYGESNPVLEESWRRTYYMLHISDQSFAIVANRLVYTLAHVPNHVDLPCDDEYYESGQIPAKVSWQDYEDREFADVEVIFSSIVYLYDIGRIVAKIMATTLETGNFSEAAADRFDTSLAVWTTLLPACKKDPLWKNDGVDEIMFTAHMTATVVLNTLHRPFSSLSQKPEELMTEAFVSHTPFVVPHKLGRGAHTARTLKALEMQTKLLAIPCKIERHNVWTMSMAAQLAAVQISACTILLEDHAYSIARDRVRLSIGFLTAMGSFWTLGTMMAKEVRAIARNNLASSQHTVAMEPAGEVNFPRDDIIWPVNPSAQIDIYSGLMLPMDLGPDRL